MSSSIKESLSRFDRLLKAMSQGEPHKAEKRTPPPKPAPPVDTPGK